MASSGSLPKWPALLARSLPPFLLMLGGMLLCMHFGFRGLFAIDQSIVWHGAARWMNGEMFVNDIRTPNGFTPIVMQAFLFRLFGMSWWTYVFHAGIMNGLFGLVVYALLLRMGGPRWLAFLFAAMSTLVFYAPMSTPFMDQHAYFFSVWAVLLAMPRLGASLWIQRIEFALLPVALLLGALSKQIPTAFFLPVVGFALAMNVRRSQWRHALGPLLAGTILAVILACWWFPPWKTDFAMLRLTLFELPSSVGGERWSRLGFHKPFGLLRQLLTDPFQALNQRKEFYRILFLVVIIGSALVPILLRLLPKLPRPAFKPLLHLPALILLHLAGGLSLVLTLNDRENSIPFVFITLGGIASILWKMGTESQGNRVFRGVTAAAAIFLLINGLWDAGGFWRDTQGE